VSRGAFTVLCEWEPAGTAKEGIAGDDESPDGERSGVGVFLATECTFEAGVKMSRSALRETLMKWCEDERINRVPSA